MPVTKEYLEGEMANVRNQKDHALAIAAQAEGALAALQAVMDKLNEEPPHEGA